VQDVNLIQLLLDSTIEGEGLGALAEICTDPENMLEACFLINKGSGFQACQ
jgi:hypothetical protein